MKSAQADKKVTEKAKVKADKEKKKLEEDRASLIVEVEHLKGVVAEALGRVGEAVASEPWRIVWRLLRIPLKMLWSNFGS